MVSDFRDRGCVCDYYGGEYDLRRSYHEDCPIHRKGLITLTSFDPASKERMYHIPKGTYVGRQWRRDLHSPYWETFKTENGVTYKEDSDGIHWPGGEFMFVPLPSCAAPFEQQLKNRTPGKYWNRPHHPTKQERIKWRADIGAKVNDAITSRLLPNY
jgi:hypothetical protein